MKEMPEIQVQSLGQEDPPEEGITTHSSILAWRFPCTEEPGGLQSMGSQRVRQDSVCTFARVHTHTHTHTCNELLVLLLSADLFVLTPFPIVNSVYIFSNVYLTVQREVAVSSQVFHVACNFSRSDVFVKQQTLYKVDYSVSPNIDIQEASIKERKRKKNVTKF